MLSLRVNEILEEKNLTPYWLGKQTGISQNNILKICNIYKITNKINNYVYVGSTSRTLEERFQEHCRPSSSDESHNPNSIFYKDIQNRGQASNRIK